MTETATAPFVREGRYVVIKPKRLSPSQLNGLQALLDVHRITPVDCVVVEADWPEYEPVWGMIEARMMGTANPFAGLRADAMTAIGELLKIARRSDDYDTSYDEINRLITAWRAARGDDAFDHWNWWIGEVDGAYGLDFASRDEAIAAAPAAIREGYPHSEDGRFNIIEARFWNDDIHPEDDEYPFAETRNHETLSIKDAAQ